MLRMLANEPAKRAACSKSLDVAAMATGPVSRPAPVVAALSRAPAPALALPAVARLRAALFWWGCVPCVLSQLLRV